MPEKYRKWPLRAGDPDVYRLKDAARDGLLLEIRCHGCRRTHYFLASDMAALYGGDQPAWMPPMECSRCGTREMMRVNFRSPRDGDYGNLDIRRPGPVKHIQTWRSIKLGDL